MARARLVEEEAEALKAGQTHQYHKDFRKHVEFVKEPIKPAPAIEVEEDYVQVGPWS